MAKVKRCCFTCLHCDVEAKTCEEGGHTDIGNLTAYKSEEGCNTWREHPSRKDIPPELVEQVEADVFHDLEQWIDTGAIADTIIQTLKDEGLEVTVENAHLVWLDFLETELSEGLKGSAAALVGKGEVQTVVKEDEDV